MGSGPREANRHCLTSATQNVTDGFPLAEFDVRNSYISIGGCTNNVPLVCSAAYLSFSAPFPVFFGAFNLAGSGGACATPST